VQPSCVRRRVEALEAPLQRRERPRRLLEPRAFLLEVRRARPELARRACDVGQRPPEPVLDGVRLAHVAVDRVATVAAAPAPRRGDRHREDENRYEAREHGATLAERGLERRV
jgi:hypothetical protein